MADEKYKKTIQTAVTNFLYCGDEYLFLHRKPDKRIDPNRLNGIGGRVEPGENYLDAAIRETEEETGYKVTMDAIQLSGVVRLEGGYDEDWVMCFFKIKVPSKKIPIGNDTKDGKLIWLHKDKVLNSRYELVDDLNYCFEEILKEDELFFMTAQMNKDQKVLSVSTSKLAK